MLSVLEMAFSFDRVPRRRRGPRKCYTDWRKFLEVVVYRPSYYT